MTRLVGGFLFGAALGWAGHSVTTLEFWVLMVGFAIGIGFSNYGADNG